MDRVCIIAEAGVNHNGDIRIAKELVDAACMAGADIVKFQTFNVDQIASVYAEMAEYQKNNIGETKSQKDMLRELCLTEDDYYELNYYCEKKGIEFLSTPFDLSSIDFLCGMGLKKWKIPSGEITNYPYLKKIAELNQEIILSTGMSSIEEVREAVKLIKRFGKGKITLLHCTTQYPAPFCDVNLNAMVTLKKEFGLDVGYSDHTVGITIPIAAVSLGAKVIEKHFTLDRTMKGPDHKASIEPDELKEMVKQIRIVETALGSGEKIPVTSEKSNMSVARKSIVARCKIKKGDVLSSENLTTKRPGTGITPMMWENIIGTQAVRNFDEDELIEI